MDVVSRFQSLFLCTDPTTNNAIMISMFDSKTALLLIDVQKGVCDLAHWGGPIDGMNNKKASARQQRLLTAFRA